MRMCTSEEGTQRPEQRLRVEAGDRGIEQSAIADEPQGDLPERHMAGLRIGAEEQVEQADERPARRSSRRGPAPRIPSLSLSTSTCAPCPLAPQRQANVARLERDNMWRRSPALTALAQMAGDLPPTCWPARIDLRACRGLSAAQSYGPSDRAFAGRAGG